MKPSELKKGQTIKFASKQGKEVVFKIAAINEMPAFQGKERAFAKNDQGGAVMLVEGMSVQLITDGYNDHA